MHLTFSAAAVRTQSLLVKFGLLLAAANSSFLCRRKYTKAANARTHADYPSFQQDDTVSGLKLPPETKPEALDERLDDETCSLSGCCSV